jgi:hypothetical protein
MIPALAVIGGVIGIVAVIVIAFYVWILSMKNWN